MSNAEYQLDNEWVMARKRRLEDPGTIESIAVPSRVRIVEGRRAVPREPCNPTGCVRGGGSS